MTARGYLGQLNKKNSEINREMEKLAMIRANAYGVTAIRYDKDSVQSSPGGDGLLDSAIEIIEQEKKVKELQSDYASFLCLVMNQINGMANKSHRLVLYERYVRGSGLDAIGAQIGKKKRWTIKLLNEAESAFYEKYLQKM